MPASFPPNSAQPAIFGTGADGNVVVSAGTTTLARDMHYSNLTITGTGRINVNGFLIFVSGVLDLSTAPANALSSISVSAGANAVGSAAPGAANVTGFSRIGGGSQQNGGVTGTAGVGGNGGTMPSSYSSASIAQGGDPGAGGAGGAGTNAGGTGGAAATDSFRVNLQLPTPTTVFQVNAYPNAVPTVFPLIGGGGQVGGGAGGGDGTNAGGGSGAGGAGAGAMAIFAAFLNRGAGTAAGAIYAKGQAGGNGGTPAAGNTGGGGGGSGGGGGWFYGVFGQLLGAAAANIIDVSGGLGGNGGNGLGTGKGGNGGTGANSGNAQVIVLSPPAFTSSTFNQPGTAGATTATITGAAGGAGATLRVNL